MLRAFIRSPTAPGLYSFFSLTEPTAGVFCPRSGVSIFAVIWLISAADIQFAAPAGRSSMVMAIWRSAATQGNHAKARMHATEIGYCGLRGFMELPPQMMKIEEWARK